MSVRQRMTLMAEMERVACRDLHMHDKIAVAWGRAHQVLADVSMNIENDDGTFTLELEWAGALETLHCQPDQPFYRLEAE